MFARGFEFYLLDIEWNTRRLYSYPQADMHFSVYYINNKIKEIFSNFPKTSQQLRIFPKIWKFSEDCSKLISIFPIIFRKLRRLPKVAEYFRAIFRNVLIIWK